MNRVVYSACALIIGLVMTAPLAPVSAAGCSVTHPKVNHVTGTQVTCTGPTQVAASYVAKMPFRPLLPKLQTALPPTIAIGVFPHQYSSFSIEYSGESLLTNARPVIDVRVMETNAPLAGKGKKAQRWKAIVALYSRYSKRFGARVIKLSHGRTGIWFSNGRPTALFAHGVSIQISGSSATSGAGSQAIEPRLTMADTITLANSLKIWHAR